jgi:hypothetical protein
MHHPSQRDFQQGEIILLGDRTDYFDCFEIVVFEVPLLIHLSLPFVNIGEGLPAVFVETTFGNIFVGTIFSGEEAACKGIINDNLNTESTTDGDEFGLDTTMNGIVDG